MATRWTACPAAWLRPNGVTSSYGYDAAGRLTSLTHSNAGGVLQSYGYTLDANGNRTGVTTLEGSESYTLDGLNRLTNVTYANGDSASYTYDANGNRTSQSANGATTNYTYDAAGQLLSDGTNSYTYDANGNLTNAGGDSFSWDWANRLVGANVDGVTAGYTYDALDVRTGATVDGAASSYLWDRLVANPQLVDDGEYGYLHGLGVMAQFAPDMVGAAGLPAGDADVTPFAHSLYLPLMAGGTASAADAGLVQAAQAAPGSQFLLGDGLGSIRGIADASGALTGSAAFGAFGDIRNQSGADSRFGYTGEYLAAETGLWHLRARDLDPSTGRFLSADTVQPNAPGTQGFNLYTYTANNPTTWVDPGGHSVLPQMLFSLENAGNELGGFALAIAKVFLYIACILDGQCREDLDSYAAILGQYSSEMPESYQWTIDKLLQVHDMVWPILPYVESGLYYTWYALNVALPYGLSAALGMIPVVGDIYDAVTAILGYDPITGETLSDWERGLALAAALLPFIAASELRAANRAFDGLDDLAYLANRACSFDADTPVATGDGFVPIGDIEVGDHVLAWHESVEETGVYTVTAVWAHEDPVVVNLTIDGELIETTPEHPFLTTDGQWMAAGELAVGAELRSANGHVGVVDAVEFVTAPQLMYNMTVADAHTYAVGDGQWVVHNSCSVFVDGVNLSHIFEGEINNVGKAVGFHYAGGAWYIGKARINAITTVADANGVFRESERF
ncbi:MAG: polymorphic toxin-type HINT domain-containing protein [Caldilineaceae bacterium]